MQKIVKKLWKNVAKWVNIDVKFEKRSLIIMKNFIKLSENDLKHEKNYWKNDKNYLQFEKKS